MIYSKSRHIIALLGISTLFLFEYFSLNLLNVIEPAIAKEFGCTNAEIGWLGSVYFYAMMILLVPAGFIIDKYNLKKVIVLCAVAGSIGTFLLSISQSYTHLIVSRAIVGVFLGPFALIACIKFISNLVKRDEVGIYISAILFIGIFGGALSQDAFGFMVNSIGWRAALIVIGIIGMCISAILFITVNIYGHKQLKIIKPNTSLYKEIITFIRGANISINFKLGIMASVLNLPLFVLGSLFGVAFLEQCYGFTATTASGITTCLFWGMLFGCIVFGMLSTRGFKENTLLFIGGLISLMTLSLLILVSISNAATLKIIFFSIGVGAGSHVLSYSLIDKISDYKSLGLAEGFHSALIFLGGALIQPMFGEILDITRTYMVDHNIDPITGPRMPYNLGFTLLMLLVLLGLYCMKMPSSQKDISLTDAAANTK